jgi:hypothetical protein
MSDIKFNCANCGCSLLVEATSAGCAADCPHCGVGLVIPSSPLPEEKVFNAPSPPQVPDKTERIEVQPQSAHNGKVWYYHKAGREHGPISYDTLQELANTGTLDRNCDKVWRDGFANWVPAGTIKGLFKAPPPCFSATVSNRQIGTFKKRDLGTIIALSIVTLGIYTIYLIASYADDMNAILGRKKYNAGTVLLLSILTVGIAAVVYHIRYADDFQTIARENGKDSSIGALVLIMQLSATALAIFTAGLGYFISLFLSIWAIWLVQNEINAYTDAHGS